MFAALQHHSQRLLCVARQRLYDHFGSPLVLNFKSGLFLSIKRLFGFTQTF